MKESWVPIRGFEDAYMISNYGRVKSLDRYVTNPFNISKKRLIKGSYKKAYITKRVGYFAYDLHKNNKRYKTYAHQLAYDAFLPMIRVGSGLQVDHIDDNPLNNRIDNLQLLTNRENTSKGRRCTERNLPVGVVFAKGKFKATIYFKGKTYQLGTYKTQQNASITYQKAKADITSGIFNG